MNVKVISIIAIVATIVGISVSYASLSTVIDITTAGSVRAAEWDVHINDLSDPTIIGDVDIISPPVAINGTTIIENLNVRFNENNSSVVYYFELVNAGDLDAIITNVDYPTPTCTSTDIHTAYLPEDILNVCDNLTYELTYSADGSQILENDILTAGETAVMKLTFAYAGTELPINEISISGLDYNITYLPNR